MWPAWLCTVRHSVTSAETAVYRAILKANRHIGTASETAVPSGQRKPGSDIVTRRAIDKSQAVEDRRRAARLDIDTGGR